MATRLEVMVDAAVRRMDDFACECVAIVETHRKRDCSPMWRAVMLHEETGEGSPVLACLTVAEANETWKEE